jgi:hypothetical protein
MQSRPIDTIDFDIQGYVENEAALLHALGFASDNVLTLASTDWFPGKGSKISRKESQLSVDIQTSGRWGAGNPSRLPSLQTGSRAQPIA